MGARPGWCGFGDIVSTARALADEQGRWMGCIVTILTVGRAVLCEHVAVEVGRVEEGGMKWKMQRG